MMEYRLRKVARTAETLIFALIIALGGAHVSLACGCGAYWTPGTPMSGTKSDSPHCTCVKGVLAFCVDAVDYDERVDTFTNEVTHPADELVYQWNASNGDIGGSGSCITWTAPNTPGVYTITCTVNDKAVIPPGECGARDDEPALKFEWAVYVNKGEIWSDGHHIDQFNIPANEDDDNNNGVLDFRETGSPDPTDVKPIDGRINYVGGNCPFYLTIDHEPDGVRIYRDSERTDEVALPYHHSIDDGVARFWVQGRRGAGWLTMSLEGGGGCTDQVVVKPWGVDLDVGPCHDQLWEDPLDGDIAEQTPPGWPAMGMIVPYKGYAQFSGMGWQDRVLKLEALADGSKLEMWDWNNQLQQFPWTTLDGGVYGSFKGLSPSGQTGSVRLKLSETIPGPHQYVSEDLVNITVAQADLTIEDRDEDNEDQIHRPIAMNDDDDDGNNVCDMSESPITYADDELVGLTYTVIPQGVEGDWQVRDGDCSILTWTDALKTSPFTGLTEYGFTKEGTFGPGGLFYGTFYAECHYNPYCYPLLSGWLDLTYGASADRGPYGPTGGGATCYDSVLVNPVDPDITLSGLDNCKELTTGGAIGVNDDDDDGVPGIDKDYTGQIGEEHSDDELVPLTISFCGDLCGQYSDQLVLSTESGGGNVRFWSDSRKTQQIYPGTFYFADDEQEHGVYTLLHLVRTNCWARTIYVEGIAASSAQGVVLKVRYQPRSGENLVYIDKLRFTVAQTDIDVDSNNDGSINETDDPIEELDPGCQIMINDDDDNYNSIPDKDEDGPILYENDLVEARLAAAPQETGAAVKLVYRIDFPYCYSPCIKVWDSPTKDHEIQLAARGNPPRCFDHTWIIGQDTIPSSVWVEGLSGGSFNLSLEYYWPQDNEAYAHRDTVRMYVCDHPAYTAFHPYDNLLDPDPTFLRLKGGFHIHWFDDNNRIPPGKRIGIYSRPPADVAQFYADDGYNFIAMTEHDHLTPDTGGSFYRITWCEEVTRPSGGSHILAIGVNGQTINQGVTTTDLSPVYDSYCPIPHDWPLNVWDFNPRGPGWGQEIIPSLPDDGVIRTIHQMGGLAFIAHPSNSTYPLAPGVRGYDAQSLYTGALCENHMARWDEELDEDHVEHDGRLVSAYSEEDSTPCEPSIGGKRSTWMLLDAQGPTSPAIVSALATDRWWSYVLDRNVEYYSVIGFYPSLNLRVGSDEILVIADRELNECTLRYSLGRGRHGTLSAGPPTPVAGGCYQYIFRLRDLMDTGDLKWARVEAVGTALTQGIPTPQIIPTYIYSNPIRFVRTGYYCDSLTELSVSYSSGPGSAPPNGVIGNYYEVSEPAEPTALILPYGRNDVSQFGAANLRLFRYDPQSSTWGELSSQVDQDRRMVSATISTGGIYAIGALSVADNQAPTAQFTEPLTGATVSGVTNVSVSASDNVGVGTVTFLLDDAQVAVDRSAMDGGWSTSIDFTKIVSGSHTLTAVATDNAGNTTSTTRQVSVQSPSAYAPVIAMDPPSYNSTDQTIEVTGTALDADGSIRGVYVDLDGTLVATTGAEDTTGEWLASFPALAFGPGTHTIAAKAVDDAGNSATDSWTGSLTLGAVVLDGDPPSPELTGASVTFTASPIAGGTLEYKYDLFDGSQWTPLRVWDSDEQFVWNPTTAGTYTVKVTAREVGYQDEKTDLLNYAICAQLSAVSLSFAPSSPQPVNTDIVMTALPTGGADVECKFEVLSGGNWVPLCGYSLARSYVWKPGTSGTYSLRAVAREQGTQTEFASTGVQYVIQP